MSKLKLTNPSISIESESSKKKQYSKPFLSQLGSITTLTLGGGSPCLDGESTNAAHKEAGNSCKNITRRNILILTRKVIAAYQTGAPCNILCRKCKQIRPSKNVRLSDIRINESRRVKSAA